MTILVIKTSMSYLWCFIIQYIELLHPRTLICWSGSQSTSASVYGESPLAYINMSHVPGTSILPIVSLMFISMLVKTCRSQLHQKRDYAMRLVEQHYSPGDIVYKLDSTTKVRQSRSPWTGPYLVISCNAPLNTISNQ